MEVVLRHPFSMLVAGGRKTGKTEFTKSLLENSQLLVDPYPERIVWCSTKHQSDLYKQLIAINSNIEYVHGIPIDIDIMFNRGTNNLVVLDMMDEATQDVRISQLFSRGRHDNLSVIYLT